MTEKNPETFSAIVSTYVNEQVPEFVRQNNPYFVEYLKAFYQFLEQPLGPIGRVASFQDAIDIDFTTDEFFSLFKSTYLSPFPEEFVADRALVVKRIKDLYSAKGSIPALKLLFRILYGEEISVFLPKTKILRASDGKWTKNITLYVVAMDGDPETFMRLSFEGEVSGATADVESIEKTQEGPYTVYTLYLVSYSGTFIPGEVIRERAAGLLSAVVLGFVDSVTVTAPGDAYTVGDPVVIDDAFGVNALASVSKIDSTYPIKDFTIVDGGDGYRVGDPILFDTEVNNGIGAVAKIGSVDVTFSEFIQTSTIGEYQTTVLFDVQFIEIGNFGNIELIETGIIDGVTLFEPGINYPAVAFPVGVGQKTPTYGLLPGAGASILANTKNAGKVLEVQIGNSGFGYSPSSTADFSAEGNGLATGLVNISGGPKVSGGFYRNTDGQLSSDMVLEDNVYYQNYSYEITSSRSINEWRSVVKAVTHPAGYALWGNLELFSKITNSFRINTIPIGKEIVAVMPIPLGVEKYVFVNYSFFVECSRSSSHIPIIAPYADDEITPYASIVLADFFAISVSDCNFERDAIVDVSPMFLMISYVMGYRSTIGIPQILDYWDNPISLWSETDLLDFFELSNTQPDADQYVQRRADIVISV